MSDDRGFRTGEILAGGAVWTEPPDVLDRVLATIDPPPAPRRGLWWTTAAAVVALVVVAGSMLLGREEPADFTLAGTELAPAATAEVRVVETPAGVVLRLEIAGLEPARPGSYYQGWVVSGDTAVSVGTFHMRGGDGAVAFWSGVDPEEYSELIVTRQDERAGPARSDQVVMTGRA